MLVLGSLVAVSLQRAILSQQRFYRQVRSQMERQDAVRTTAAILAYDLREAVLGAGDVTVFSSDSFRVRSPVGLGIACTTHTGRRWLALTGTSGRVDRTTGDSLLVYHPSGWIVTRVRRVNPRGPRLTCPYGGGVAPDVVVRTFARVDGVPAGATVRAFHSFTYHLQTVDGAPWLARSDSRSTEILTGPFASDGSGLVVELIDSVGQVTGTPASAARVRVTAVLDADEGRRGVDPFRRDTLVLSTGVRN